MAERIFRFSGQQFDYKGDAKSKAAKALLGGKGAGLVMMAQQGLNVPPGFTITTAACNEYRSLAGDPVGQTAWFGLLMNEVINDLEWLKSQFGYMPLVSVRSGAPISMPGMMDTILNVGLTEDNFGGWSKRLGERAAVDSQRRLVQMLGSTGYGVPMQVFDFQLAKVKKKVGVKEDTELTASDLHQVVTAYLMAFKENKGFAFPINEPYEQLKVAVRAVFDSWMNPRAIEYRKINKIDEAMGTAVNVQAMVFGNMGDDSGTGVLFSRDPSTGESGLMGEFLQNAQGEDVVAGIRTPVDVKKMAELGMGWSETYHKLCLLSDDLEAAYKDMVDIEFTVQKGELFVLQSRAGKRSARAAFRIAVDMVSEKVIDRETALGRLTRDQFKVVRRPMIDPKFKVKPHLVGLPACPGVVTGRPVFSSEDAVKATDPVILVTHETDPDDIAGMAKAVGILTKTGGATSHAAVVARAMDKTCVVGCTELDLSMADNGLIGAPGLNKHSNEDITIDGSTGRVWIGVKVPVIDASDDPAVKTVMKWCREKTGCLLASTVDVADEPHMIMAAHWWGSLTVLKAILDSLQELPSREHVVLNMQPPKAFCQPNEDAPLMFCFQAEYLGAVDKFEPEVTAELVARADKLKGLRLAVKGVPMTGKTLLKEAGYATHDGPEAVPADYAAFTTLSA